MGSSSDRNLLFGIIALQNQLITRDQLLAGMQAWTFEQLTPLGELLVRQGALQPEQRQRLEMLVAANLRLHDDDPQQSLVEVSSLATSLQGELTALGNNEINATLAHVGHSGLSQLSLSWDPANGQTGRQPIAPAQRFRVLRPHAHGGLGTVSVAEDQELHREVALKEIHGDKAHHEELRTRFIREAEITGGLEHPGIVPIYGLGSYPDGRPFYAMRFIRGDSLDKAIRRYHEALSNPEINLTASERNLRLRRLLQRFIDVCEAIDYAHSRGVLHRDLKPGNIMLGRYGETLVVDWGLAKLLGDKPELISPAATGEGLEFSIMDSLGPLAPSDEARSSDLTQDGTAVGTLPYMSPEQAAGRLDLLGPASDIFSLGATLYELLTNRPPYQGKRRDVLEAAKQAAIASPRALNPRVSKPLAAICLKALAKDQQDRYPTAKALAHDIEAYLADEPIAAKRETLWERAGRVVRRHRGAFLACTATLLVLTIGSVAAALMINEAKSRELTANTEKLAAVEREAKSKELTLLVRTLESSLDLTPWPEGQRDKLVKLQSEIATADPEIGRDSQARIDRRYIELIEAKLRNPKLAAEDYDLIQQELAWLKNRQAADYPALEAKFLARRQQWTRVMALTHDPSNAEKLFAANRIQLDPQAGLLPVADAKQTPIPLQRRGAKSVQLQAEFAPAWENSTQVGFVFQGVDKGNYEFSLLAATTAETKGSSFQALRAAEGNYLVVLQRDKQVLFREFIPAVQVKSGTLQLLARREGDTLALQVNDLPVVKTLDLFPLPAQATELALHWPANVALLNLTLSEKPEASEKSDFEKADELFRERKYAAALALYSELGTTLEHADARREAQIKAGLCHFSQKQYDDGAKYFVALSTEPGDRWPAIASCLLWLTRLEQNRRDEANVIGQQILSKFDQRRLAEGIPNELRRKVTDHYFNLMNAGKERIGFVPDRMAKLELYLAIDKAFSNEGVLSSRALGLAMKVCLDDNNLALALRYGFDAYKLPSHPFSIEYIRLLRLHGDTVECQKVIMSEAKAPNLPNIKSLLLHAEEARLLLASNKTEKANDCIIALDHYLNLESIGSSTLGHGHYLHDYFESYILSGYYKQLLGDHDAAARMWKRGMKLQMTDLLRRKNDPNHDIHFQGVFNAFVFASLLGERDNPELKLVVELALGVGNKNLQALGQFASQDQIKETVFDAFDSERGKLLIRDRAFNTNPPAVQRDKTAILLFWQFCKMNAFKNAYTPLQDKSVWETGVGIAKAFMTNGSFSVANLIQAGAAYKGITGFLGWGSLYPSLPEELKAGTAYIYANRLKQLQKFEEAKAVYEQCLKAAKPESDVHRLATEELAALRSAEQKTE
jgi:serine/threonine protein kinase